jgi:hypothetical protein
MTLAGLLERLQPWTSKSVAQLERVARFVLVVGVADVWRGAVLMSTAKHQNRAATVPHPR